MFEFIYQNYFESLAMVISNSFLFFIKFLYYIYICLLKNKIIFIYSIFKKKKNINTKKSDRNLLRKSLMKEIKYLM